MASSGYFIDSFGTLLLPQYEEPSASVVVLTAIVGELPLSFWLLIKGINVEQWNKRALEAA